MLQQAFLAVIDYGKLSIQYKRTKEYLTPLSHEVRCTIKLMLYLPIHGSSSVHKAIAVIPETHGEPITAAVLKKLVKGPYGEGIVIGGRIAGGY
jgi:hypothetical protein